MKKYRRRNAAIWSTVSRAQRADITVKIYPGATHDFDDPGPSRQDVPANVAAMRDAAAAAVAFVAAALK